MEVLPGKAGKQTAAGFFVNLNHLPHHHLAIVEGNIQRDAGFMPLFA